MPQWGRRGPGQVHFLLSPNHRERLRYGGHLPWIRDAQGTCWYLLIKVKLRENVTYSSLIFFFPIEAIFLEAIPTLYYQRKISVEFIKMVTALHTLSSHASY